MIENGVGNRFLNILQGACACSYNIKMYEYFMTIYMHTCSVIQAMF